MSLDNHPIDRARLAFALANRYNNAGLTTGVGLMEESALKSVTIRRLRAEDGRAPSSYAFQSSHRQLFSELSRGPSKARECAHRVDPGSLQEVSTRSVDDLVMAVGMSGVSKSRVSSLC